MADKTETAEILTIPIDRVVFAEAIYPRFRVSRPNVRRYADLIAQGTDMGPIEVDQHFRILDGAHRYEAHRMLGRQEIRAVMTPVRDDQEAVIIACRHNAEHGLPLSRQERRANGMHLYSLLYSDYHRPSQEDTRRIAQAMGVSVKTILRWNQDLRQERRQRRDSAVLALIAQQRSQRAIEKVIGIPRQTIQGIKRAAEKGQMSLSGRPAAGTPEDQGSRNLALQLETRRGTAALMQELCQRIQANALPILTGQPRPPGDTRRLVQGRDTARGQRANPASFTHAKQRIRANVERIINGLEDENTLDQLDALALDFLHSLTDETQKYEILELFRPLIERLDAFVQGLTSVLPPSLSIPVADELQAHTASGKDREDP